METFAPVQWTVILRTSLGEIIPGTASIRGLAATKAFAERLLRLAPLAHCIGIRPTYRETGTYQPGPLETVYREDAQ